MSNYSPRYLIEEEKKQNEYEDRYKDRLSELPDDIIISILSLVDRKEATRCSILAKSWRYMATYFTSLEFDLPPLFVQYLLQKKSLKKVKRRFVNWVNQVLTLNRASFINDFRISLPFDATYSKRVNSWITFAMAKRVKKLELDFEYGTICNDHLGHLSVPSNNSRYSLPSSVFNGSSYLISVCLKFVDISEEVLELLLSRCHSLERLHIERTSTLSSMKIINLGRKLKYLAIHECSSLEKVILHAVSLESFEFISRGKVATVEYASAPSLVEARFCWRQHLSDSLPCFLKTEDFPAHLSKLSLDIELFSLFCTNTPIVCFPNVKYLELRVLVDHIGDQSTNLLPLMCFAEGCPLLHEFKLQLIWHKCDSKVECKKVKHRLGTQEGTLPNLRKFEWRGAFSVHDELEYPLALYCVKNAINLEKFICDPRYLPSTFDNPKDGRRRAKRLRMVIPSHIEYLILYCKQCYVLLNLLLPS